MKIQSYDHLELGARHEQQDACVRLVSPDEESGFFVLADGVGGQSGGQLASAAAIAEARRFWEEVEDRGNPRQFLLQFARAAHEEINQTAAESGSRGRATIVALLIQNGQAHWIHSGDSRLYHYRNGAQLERTSDHSVVQILVEQGKLDEREMGTHPDQGRLLQSLGGEDFVEPEYHSTNLSGAESFLLCSDGFWERASREELCRFASNSKNWPSEGPKLAGKVVNRGGDKADNLSLVCVSLTAPGGVAAAAGLPGGIRLSHVVFLLLGLVVGLAFAYVVKEKSSRKSGDREEAKANPAEAPIAVGGQPEPKPEPAPATIETPEEQHQDFQPVAPRTPTLKPKPKPEPEENSTTPKDEIDGDAISDPDAVPKPAAAAGEVEKEEKPEPGPGEEKVEGADGAILRESPETSAPAPTPETREAPAGDPTKKQDPARDETDLDKEVNETESGDS